MPAHGIVLPVGTQPLLVLVALVGRDHDGDDWSLRGRGVPAQGFEQIDRAHHVRGERLDRNVIGEPDERLSREVKDELRLEVVNQRGERSEIGEFTAHIASEQRR